MNRTNLLTMSQSMTQRTQSPAEFRFSSFGRILFWLFAIYLVIPLVDIPLLGLSPSAFFIFIVALEALFGKNALSLSDFKSWTIIIYFLWLGFFLSMASNVLAGNFVPGFFEYFTLIRITFWIMSFFVTLLIIKNISTVEIRKLAILIGIAIIFLGIVRVFEGMAFGRWGGGGTSRILSQNSYGILFSRFTPFAVILCFMFSGILRQISILGLIILLFAIAANGSRSSWIAVAMGLLVSFILYLIAQPHHKGKLIWIISLLLILINISLLILPTEVLIPISDRFATLEKFEEDKSFATRQLMVQKSLRLYNNNQLFGAGPGQFNQTYVNLEIPYILSGSTKDFNMVAAHNSYTKHLAETGLVGTVPFALLIIMLLFRGLSATLHSARREEVWAIAIYASFIAMSIHMWSIDNLGNTSPWFVYGLVAGVIERNKLTTKVNLRQ